MTTPVRRSEHLRKLIVAAILSALAAVLMFLEFPLTFLAPPFYQLDFSEVPVLIGSFALGPWWAAAIEIVKNILKLFLKSTGTVGVGEIANALIGCAMVVPAGLIYQRHKTRKGALWGMGIGTLILLPVSALLNILVLLPTYSWAMNIPMQVFIDMGTAINPWISGEWTFALLAVIPFNLLKAVLTAIITYFLYKPLSALIHGRVGR